MVPLRGEGARYAGRLGLARCYAEGDWGLGIARAAGFGDFALPAGRGNSWAGAQYQTAVRQHGRCMLDQWPKACALIFLWALP